MSESFELEQLRADAEKLGYKLVKIPEKVTLLSCPVCGSKNTRVWYLRYDRQHGTERGLLRKCNICGFEGKAVARGELATKKAWNEAVEEYLKGESQ